MQGRDKCKEPGKVDPCTNNQGPEELKQPQTEKDTEQELAYNAGTRYDAKPREEMEQPMLAEDLGLGTKEIESVGLSQTSECDPGSRLQPLHRINTHYQTRAQTTKNHQRAKAC